jgi:hypothetical protein
VAVSTWLPLPSVAGVYVKVQVLSAAATAGESVQAAGTNVPVPPLTEKFTVPVGCATVTVLLFVSFPVSWTVTVQVPVAWLTLRVVLGQVSDVCVTWPAVTVVVPDPVSRLKKPLQTPAPVPGTQSLTADPVLLLALVSV